MASPHVYTSKKSVSTCHMRKADGGLAFQMLLLLLLVLLLLLLPRLLRRQPLLLLLLMTLRWRADASSGGGGGGARVLAGSTTATWRRAGARSRTSRRSSGRRREPLRLMAPPWVPRMLQGTSMVGLARHAGAEVPLLLLMLRRLGGGRVPAAKAARCDGGRRVRRVGAEPA